MVSLKEELPGQQGFPEEEVSEGSDRQTEPGGHQAALWGLTSVLLLS